MTENGNNLIVLDGNTIKNLELGHPAAENEILQLNNYFVHTKAYYNAKKEKYRKIFYIGHRGDGKSALFSQLAFDFTQSKSNIIVNISPEEYSYEAFKKKEHSFPNIKAAFGSAWRHNILVKVLIETHSYFQQNPNIKRNRDNVKRIEKYLLEAGLIGKPQGLAVLIDFLKQLSLKQISFKSKHIDAEFEKQESNRFIELLELQEMQDVIVALNTISVSHPIHIFIDELDRGWDNSDEAKNFINGLFMAVSRLNKMPNLKIYVSLRKDMYNNLLESIPDAEKMRADIELLKWDKQDLKCMLGSRIQSNFSKADQEKISPYDALTMVFNEDAVDYMIEHTLYRPREIIDFSIKAIDEYARIYMLHKWRRKIDLDIIKSIEGEFSNARLSDFCSEFQFEFPNIRTILLTFEYGKVCYERLEFLSTLEEAMLKLADKKSEHEWLVKIDFRADELMKILYSIGFIKVFIVNKGVYEAFHQTALYNFDRIEKVKINDVFCEALKCY